MKPIKFSKKISRSDWTLPKDAHDIVYPDGGQHATFFKSIDEKHLFAMTKTNRIYEIIKVNDKHNPFKIMQVL